MRAPLALALWLCLSGAALAEAPKSASAPQSRAAVTQAEAAAAPPRANPRRPLVGTVAVTATGTGALAAAGPRATAPSVPAAAQLSANRPAPRPAALAKPSGQSAQTTRLATLSALLRPLPRPADLTRTKRTASIATPDPIGIQRVAFVAPAMPDALGRQKSGAGLCGVPTLSGRKIAPVASRVNGCGIPDAVEITAVDGIRLSQPATIDCTTATAFDRWVRTGLKPAVGRTGGGISRIQIAGSYACRPRNNVRGAKVSEHGRGRAVDVSGIVLANGQVLTVARDWRSKKGGEILRTAYRAACGTFGTTLGPGSDGYHEDHMHFDTAAYRRGAYCR